MATREQAVQALFTRLTVGGTYAGAGRRVRNPDGLSATNQPLLSLVQHSETFHRPSPSSAPIRTLHLRALLYSDVGDNENAIPQTVINGLMESVEAALLPDQQNRCTLGGLVFSVMIVGDVINAPGDLTGKSVAVVPIDIVLP